MNKQRFFDTILKKYAFGYIIAVLFLFLFFFLSIFSTMLLSVRYQRASKNLVEVNEVENAINDLNNDIIMSYSYFLDKGISGYDKHKEILDDCLEKTKSQLSKNYVRETADLNSTIETYTAQSDGLIEDLKQYIANSNHTVKSNDDLESKYNNLQKIYSFIDLRFQDVYASELNVLETEERELRSLQFRIIVILGCLLTLMIFACIYYVSQVIRDISNSINTMMAGVNALQENVDGAQPIAINSGDEFEELAYAFNSMQLIIQLQMNDIAESASIKERLAEAENENLKMYGALQKNHLDFLQSRINPHFLFNTLNMILSQARLENAEKSAELMTITASFLRYNLDNITKTVTLEKELDNLKDYISIQKYRYGERFLFCCNAQKDVLDLAMPSMILQPLVENSIQHGIGMMMNGGKIWIDAMREGSRVLFKIEDNGTGMTDQQIQNVYKSLQDNNLVNSHIGIRNIFQRLQLFYNDDVTILMENRDPGLNIMITVPYQPKGNAMKEEAANDIYNGNCR